MPMNLRIEGGFIYEQCYLEVAKTSFLFAYHTLFIASFYSYFIYLLLFTNCVNSANVRYAVGSASAMLGS
jgi:hypothetical protein